VSSREEDPELASAPVRAGRPVRASAPVRAARPERGEAPVRVSAPVRVVWPVRPKAPVGAAWPVGVKAQARTDWPPRDTVAGRVGRPGRAGKENELREAKLALDGARKSGKERDFPSLRHLAWLGALVVVALLLGWHGHGSAAPRAGVDAGGASWPLATVTQPKPHSLLSVRPAALEGVSLPGTGQGDRPLPPVRLLLVFDKPMSGTDRSDLAALGTWIEGHERAGTVVRVLFTRPRLLLTRTMSPGMLARIPTAVTASWRLADRWAKRRIARGAPAPIRLALAVGAAPSRPALKDVRTGSVTLEYGAPVPSATFADPRRADALAAALALQIIDNAGQQETDAPHLTHKQ
jgi:hypothetical protein